LATSWGGTATWLGPVVPAVDGLEALLLVFVVGAGVVDALVVVVPVGWALELTIFGAGALGAGGAAGALVGVVSVVV
jgi:hypothetical protein